MESVPLEVMRNMISHKVISGDRGDGHASCPQERRITYILEFALPTFQNLILVEQHRGAPDSTSDPL
jgi:hypothetical protein